VAGDPETTRPKRRLRRRVTSHSLSSPSDPVSPARSMGPPGGWFPQRTGGPIMLASDTRCTHPAALALKQRQAGQILAAGRFPLGFGLTTNRRTP
jgi:hypothetical protein